MEAASRRRSLSRLATRGMQALIVAVLVVGVRSANVTVVVNAVVALAVTFLPAVLERDYRIPLSPGLTLWVTTAVLLHALGMVGLYGSVWWWDHLTHTLSATIVASVGYATARVVDEHSELIVLPPRFLFAYVVLFTLAFGVLWEVLEFVGRLVAAELGVEPVLVQYGLEDTLVDLVFDTVGALVVGLFGTRRLSGVVDDLLVRFRPGDDDRP